MCLCVCVCVFAGAIGIGTTTVGNTLKHPDFLKNPAMDASCVWERSGWVTWSISVALGESLENSTPGNYDTNAACDCIKNSSQ